jgi:hypothetical protein
MSFREGNDLIFRHADNVSYAGERIYPRALGVSLPSKCPLTPVGLAIEAAFQETAIYCKGLAVLLQCWQL